ncbi:MAG: NAD(P)/FAD-dependent oxidoreductase [Candidatus Omnitrophota bacterium]
MKTKIIVIVGGGPAGMISAIRAGELSQKVILLEKKSSLGIKLLLSGKGRCNLTNACSLEAFLKRFSKNGEFLRDSFKKFFNHELIDFFQRNGLKLKTERQFRVFPVTDSSKSVLDVLNSELLKNNVKVIYNVQVKDIVVEGGKVKEAVLTANKKIPCDKIILATGGVSYPLTGSSGDGLRIAKALGHKVTDLRPGLVPLETRENYPKRIEGLTLKNIRLTFTCDRKEITSEVGELLFTGFGVSGPLVLTLSGRIAEWLRAGEKVFLDIDLKPALTEEKLNERLLREFKTGAKKNLKNTLKELLPLRLVDLSLEILKIDPRKQASYVTQEERRRLVLFLKGFRLEIKDSLPIETGMVTRGGVSLKEINPRTMESRIIKGLYFAGEIIDVDADTGGFNLQAAFSTGYLAGESAALAE